MLPHWRLIRCALLPGLAAAFPLAALGACAFFESSDEKTPSLAFVTTDGETGYDVNGTWRGPCQLGADGIGSQQVLLDFLNKDHVRIHLNWTDATSCPGDPDTVEQYEGKLTIDGTKSVGWNAAAPSVLPNPITASTFTHRLNDPADFGSGNVRDGPSVGLVVSMADPVVLYVGSGFDAGLTLGEDGYPTELKDEPYYKD